VGNFISDYFLMAKLNSISKFCFSKFALKLAYRAIDNMTEEFPSDHCLGRYGKKVEQEKES